MLLTIERVIILKSVGIFSEVPEEDLVEVASIVEEVEVEAGKEIIKKGDIGTSMYIIVKGRAKVHDGDKVIAELPERTVFGELAALDPEPRSASVSALVDCELFKLEEGPLYDLMAEHVEVVRGIIRVLCRRMRNMLQPKPAQGKKKKEEEKEPEQRQDRKQEEGEEAGE
jgi:CRP-like cAMP-binding protein